LAIDRVFADLGLTVLERGWLSSNNIVFAAAGETPATVVDTGYVSHADQTCALVSRQLRGQPLGRVLNTHLHSDHCGGNAALQARWGCEVWVPEASFDDVLRWDEKRLTFDATGQRCDRFTAQRALCVGESVQLGARAWQVIAAPGHDPYAVMFFEPESRVVITADALWEHRVAINFPTLDGEPGFDAALAALDSIERLAPSVCIPGHGAPFTDLAAAIARSRCRLAQFAAEPARHLAYAERALTMFHMLEWQAVRRDALVQWLAEAPIFRAAWRDVLNSATRAEAVVERLLADGLLRLDEADTLRLP